MTSCAVHNWLALVPSSCAGWVLWEAGSEMGTPVQDVNWECPGIHTCEREGGKKSAGQMEGRLKLWCRLNHTSGKLEGALEVKGPFHVALSWETFTHHVCQSVLDAAIMEMGVSQERRLSRRPFSECAPSSGADKSFVKEGWILADITVFSTAPRSSISFLCSLIPTPSEEQFSRASCWKAFCTRPSGLLKLQHLMHQQRLWHHTEGCRGRVLHEMEEGEVIRPERNEPSKHSTNPKFHPRLKQFSFGNFYSFLDQKIDSKGECDCGITPWW